MSKVYKTISGVPYLKEPGICVLGSTAFNYLGIENYVSSFDPELEFEGYLDDLEDTCKLHKPIDGSMISKTSGQICYQSFSPNRTKNNNIDKYITNIKKQSHFSVLEHANYTLLLYGVSRSLTMEFNRHRHMSPSQVSQRYVDGKCLRFVERPDFQNDEELHTMFESRIDKAYFDYHKLAEILMDRQENDPTLVNLSKTDRRKMCNQAARALLPNETEAPVVYTGNARAWRSVINKRATEHAEVEIRKLAVMVLETLQKLDLYLFNDYEIYELPSGHLAARTEYTEV